jgi:hypothetical protein
VCVRERACVYVCARERERERENMCVCRPTGRTIVDTSTRLDPRSLSTPPSKRPSRAPSMHAAGPQPPPPPQPPLARAPRHARQRAAELAPVAGALVAQHVKQGEAADTAVARQHGQQLREGVRPRGGQSGKGRGTAKRVKGRVRPRGDLLQASCHRIAQGAKHSLRA